MLTGDPLAGIRPRQRDESIPSPAAAASARPFGDSSGSGTDVRAPLVSAMQGFLGSATLVPYFCLLEEIA